MNIYTPDPKAIFSHYLQQLKVIVDKIDQHTQGDNSVLQHSLHEGMLPLLAQLRTAANFSLRACCPLNGRERISFDNSDETFAGVQLQLDQTIHYLQTIPASDFIRIPECINDQAGFTQLTLPTAEYLYHYALPNFFFHINMAYAIARAAGVPLSKGDYDGYHSYPAGFSFVPNK
jgi:hypothetical protein